MDKPKIETCLSPALYSYYENKQAIVVIADILRATTSICEAFNNGAKSIIPVGSKEEARKYKEQGYIVAAERDGIKLDFADFGNSPFYFNRATVEGKSIVYSTTNGTHCINLARGSYAVIAGSFLHLTALSKYIIQSGRDLLILCAGWKNKVNLEDTLFAGALAGLALQAGSHHTICDSTHAAIDLWGCAQPNPIAYIQKAAQRDRLRKNGLDDSIDFCMTRGNSTIIPVLDGHELIAHEPPVN